NNLDCVAPGFNLPIVPCRWKFITYKVPAASTAGPSMPGVNSDGGSFWLSNNARSPAGEPTGGSTSARTVNLSPPAAFAAMCQAPLQPAALTSLKLYFLIFDCSVLSFVNIFTGVADSIYLSAVIPSKSTSLTPSRRPNYC